MSLYIDISYAKQASTRIEYGKLKSESPYHFNGRCKVCGDSLKLKTKTRFHMRVHGDTVMCSCFNCGLALPISAYLKLYEPDLFSNYKLEKYRVEINEPIIKSEKPAPINLEAEETAQETIKKLDLQLVSTLEKDSPAAKYVRSRCLPDYPFYYAEKFIDFSKQYNPLIVEAKEGARLVIPFFNKKGEIYAYQGRDLTGKSNVKYLTVNIDKKMPTIFGIDRVNFKKSVLLVEGPLDSLFLPNCIAAVNAGLLSVAKKLGSVVNKNSLTLVFDNEPRNKVICDMYKKALDEGYKVVIWPNELREKDINEMVLNNKDPLTLIEQNTYQGLMGQMKFNMWKKV